MPEPILGDFVLHVGLSKTATTTLQNSLFAEHPQILHLGKALHYPVSQRRACTPAIDRALTPLLWRHAQPFEPAALRDAMRAAGLDSASADEPILASWEGLSSHPHLAEMVRRAHAAFRSVRIVCVLRHPVAWATSMYLQNVRGHYLTRPHPEFGVGTYLDFDDWLLVTTERRGAAGAFRYAENLVRVLEIVGRERFALLLFEDFVRDPGRFAEDLCRFLGVDPAPAAALVAGVHRNERMSEAQLAHVRRVHRHPLRRLLWRVRGRAHAGAAWPKYAGGPAARVPLDLKRQRRILAVSTPAIRRIEAAFGVDLTHYREPLPDPSGSK